jgi:NTP pyrophosphatase (non-canonical NTP hydrolase)
MITKMRFDELIENVKFWADNKGILKAENAPKQMMKVIEELGETAGAIAKNKATDEIQDGIGDTFVTLIILAYQLGLEPADCLEAAWNEIKDRKGKTVNGVFVKEEKSVSMPSLLDTLTPDDYELDN